MRCSILLIFLVTIPMISFSQRPQKLFQLGSSIHAYKGDLNERYNNWTGGVYVGLNFNKKKRTSGALMLGIGKILGQHATIPTSQSPKPNSFFKTRFVSLNYALQYNIINKDKWRLFLSQGIGLMRYNPQDELSSDLIDQSNTRAIGELYGNIMLFLPTQIGALYFFPNNYAVAAQFGYMNLTSDYIDNISQLGSNNNGDNVLQVRFSLYAPL